MDIIREEHDTRNTTPVMLYVGLHEVLDALSDKPGMTASFWDSRSSQRTPDTLRGRMAITAEEGERRMSTYAYSVQLFATRRTLGVSYSLVQTGQVVALSNFLDSLLFRTLRRVLSPFNST